MVRENEIEIRTKEKNMLICTAKIAEDGHIDLIKRNGKKEDHFTVDYFLSQIFGRSVVVTIL